MKLSSLRYRYSPQNAIVRHHQALYFLHGEMPRFVPIQDNVQNYSFVHIDLCILGYQTRS
jgi:hypothetical protein